MNRLVIIGNGFDLAHGLPTGYCDFIDWYWKNIITMLLKQELNGASFKDELVCVEFSIRQSNYYNAFKDSKKVHDFSTLLQFVLTYSESHEPHLAHLYNSCKMNFYNGFFKIICDKRSIQNWVDIENEYYRLLKDCLKESDNLKVKKLNAEFEQIKNLLELYLQNEVEGKFNYTVEETPLSEIFSKKKYIQNEIATFRHEFKAIDDRAIHLTSQKNKAKYEDGKYLFEIENLYLLNFNYTSLVSCYLTKNLSKSFHIQIHGNLMNKKNSINFGFGDEMDKRYSEIEETGENEYLKNIKSFAYLNTPNYKRLLDIVDSQEFQVYIMGHSCGLSDRTLLNTIFEHDNCKSIKIFYHEFKKPKLDGSVDNYTEIVQNISRHFNKKKLMREKIVNKTLCQPLPQLQLPLK